MVVTTEYVDISLPVSSMRTFVAAPRAEGQYPGIWCYSDIFQLTPPLLRTCVRLAGYGFVAAAPEIYCRIEPPGTAIPFDDAGRTRGQEDAAKTPVAYFDADCRAGLDWLSKHPKVARGKIGAVGFCIGGHLAFRAAFQPDVRATVCYYGTGIHDGKLGQDADAGSLARAKEIRGELLMIFGTKDPHVPDAGRETIDRALKSSGARYNTLLYPAEHASRAMRARVLIRKRRTWRSRRWFVYSVKFSRLEKVRATPPPFVSVAAKGLRYSVGCLARP